VTLESKKASRAAKRARRAGLPADVQNVVAHLTDNPDHGVSETADVLEYEEVTVRAALSKARREGVL
jgi:hypothetical protein